MRMIMAGLAVFVAGSLGSGASLSVGSAAQWYLVAMPNLNTFASLTNQTIRFVNERIEGEDVPLLPELRHGIGLRFTEAWGETWQVGIETALVSVETTARGVWTRGEDTHPVDISLEVGLVAFAAEVALALVPDVIAIGLSAGWGITRVVYRGAFPNTLPTDWSLPFLPRVETKTYTTHGPVGSAYARVSLPFGPGMAVGFEAGFRLAPLGVPQSGTSVLDLNADGMGDPVNFSGLWLGLTVRIAFNL